MLVKTITNSSGVVYGAKRIVRVFDKTPSSGHPNFGLDTIGLGGNPFYNNSYIYEPHGCLEDGICAYTDTDTFESRYAYLEDGQTGTTSNVRYYTSNDFSALGYNLPTDILIQPTTFSTNKKRGGLYNSYDSKISRMTASWYHDKTGLGIPLDGFRIKSDCPDIYYTFTCCVAVSGVSTIRVVPFSQSLSSLNTDDTPKYDFVFNIIEALPRNILMYGYENDSLYKTIQHNNKIYNVYVIAYYGSIASKLSTNSKTAFFPYPTLGVNLIDDENFDIRFMNTNVEFSSVNPTGSWS